MPKRVRKTQFRLERIHVENTPSGGVIYCLAGKDGNVITFARGPSAGDSSARPAAAYTSSVRYVAYQRLTTDADGRPCVTTGYVAEGTAPTDDLSTAFGAHPGGNGFNNYFDFEPCPARPAVPGR